MVSLLQMDTRWSVIRAEEWCEHRGAIRVGWWEGNLELHGIREVFLVEVMFEWGLVQGVFGCPVESRGLSQNREPCEQREARG